MKLLRVTLLASALLLTASPRDVSTTTNTSAAKAQTTVRGPGDCQYVNGVWLCD